MFLKRSPTVHKDLFLGFSRVLTLPQGSGLSNKKRLLLKLKKITPVNFYFTNGSVGVRCLEDGSCFDRCFSQQKNFLDSVIMKFGEKLTNAARENTSNGNMSPPDDNGLQTQA